MRLLLGIILGIILAIGVAYLHDASASGPPKAAGQTSVEQQPVVNWDVLGRNWQSSTLGVRNTWNNLAAR
jgi:hypothetical protein